MLYRHKQIGYVMLVALAAVIALTLFLVVADWPNGWPVLAVVGVLIFTGWLLSSLSVEINNGQLKFWFGAGLIHKTVNLSDIASCRSVKNSWLAGWGIHRLPSGWLYNVSGFRAVEITLKTGKSFRLGTDEPEALCKAISQSIH